MPEAPHHSERFLACRTCLRLQRLLPELPAPEDDEPFTVRRGDRIAQLVVQEVSRVSFLEVDSLPGSHRGDTGHGASGGFGTHDRPADHAQHDRPKD